MKKFLLLLLIPLSVFAQSPKSLVHNSSTLVDDFANILTDEEERTINSKLKGFYDTAQISVVTVSSLDGMVVGDYALELFKHWGIGQKGANNGLMILIAPNEHKSSMKTGYGLEGDLPDGICGEILRSANPYFKNNDYFGGIDKIVGQSIETISPSAKAIKATAKAAQQKINKEKTSEFLNSLGELLLFLIIAGFIGWALYRWYQKDQEKKAELKSAKIDFEYMLTILGHTKKNLIERAARYSGYIKIDFDEIFEVYTNLKSKSTTYFTVEEFKEATQDLKTNQSAADKLKNTLDKLKEGINFMSTVSFLPSTITDEMNQWITKNGGKLIFNDEVKERYIKRYREMAENYTKEYVKVKPLINVKTLNELSRQLDNTQLAYKAIEAIVNNLNELINSNREKIQTAKTSKRNFTNMLKDAQTWNSRKNEVENSFYVQAMGAQSILAEGINKFNGDLENDYNLAVSLEEHLPKCYAIRNKIESNERETARKIREEQEKEARRLRKIQDDIDEEKRRQEEEDERRRRDYYSSSSSSNSSSSSSSSDYSFGGGDSGGGGADSSW